MIFQFVSQAAHFIKLKHQVLSYVQKTSDSFLFKVPKFRQPEARVMHKWQPLFCA